MVWRRLCELEALDPRLFRHFPICATEVILCASSSAVRRVWGNQRTCTRTAQVESNSHHTATPCSANRVQYDVTSFTRTGSVGLCATQRLLYTACRSGVSLLAPCRLQVLWANGVALAWNAYLSLIAHR